ncbi:hypothetical protein ECEC96038_2819, partial [Escherichia coli EC96038]
MLCIRGDG